MSFFNRRLSPDFIAAAREPSGRELVDEAKIVALDEQAFIAWRKGQLAEMDRLLDLRNAIRPARVAEVPVIPGRTS